METYEQEQHSTLIGNKIKDSSMLPDSSEVISWKLNNTTTNIQTYKHSLLSTYRIQDLLFKELTHHFNQVFEEDLGEMISDAMFELEASASPAYFSDQLVTVTTSTFRVFFDNHPELSEQAILERFMNLIYESLDKGFSEVRETLDSYHQLDGETSTFLDLSFESIIEQYNEFVDGFGYSNEEYTSQEEEENTEETRHYLWSNELIQSH
ncbi:MAG: DUF5610 domain-containing protein [Neptuniibacter sp.]